MLTDLRFALRRLARSTGFSATIILLLALALAASACGFSVVYGLLFKPLPFAAAEQTVSLNSLLVNRGIAVGLSVPLLRELAAHNQSFDAIGGYRSTEIESVRSTPATSFQAARVQAEVFSMLGAQPALGRLIVPEDNLDGAPQVAVLAWGVWQNQFGGSSAVLEQPLRLADGEYRIVGVLPRGFGFPLRSTQLWLPLRFSASELAPARADVFSDLRAIARLRPGTNAAAASDESTAIAHGMESLKELAGLVGLKIEVHPLRELWLGGRQAAFPLMLATIGLLLLVTAANLCNLYIARMLARQGELALLDALGAGRWRRLRLTFAETLSLSFVGMLAGIALVPGGLALLRALDLLPVDTPQAVGIDAMTIAFVAVLGLLLALLMSASATWLQRHAPLALAAAGVRQTASRSARSVRMALAVAQIAFAAALLVGAGLLLHSSQRLLAEQTGFDREKLVLAAITGLPKSSPGTKPDDATTVAARATTRQLLERVKALPGVSAVGLGTLAPFGWSRSVSSFSLPGGPNQPAQARAVTNRAFVNADYFAALGTTLQRGRTFSDAEAQTRADVAIVDSLFATQVFGTGDALGNTVLIADTANGAPRELTIVGIVPTMKMVALDETPQRPSIFQPDATPLNGMLLVRTLGDPALLAGPLREALSAAAPGAALRDVVPMRDRIADSMGDARRLNTLLEVLAACALLLAAIGLHAVIAFTVRMRTAEFGIRMALGASAMLVQRSVLLDGARLLLLGLLVAAPLAWLLERLLAARLYGVGKLDPLTLAGAAIVLATVSLCACWLPAWRAARVTPIEALRHE